MSGEISDTNRRQRRQWPLYQTACRHFEVPTEEHLWGKSYEVVPAVARDGYGDMESLVWISPINQRPAYYIVAVDASWASADLDGDKWRDHVDDIVMDLQSQFGSHTEDHPDLVVCGADCDWPVGNWGSGYSWGLLRSPEILRRHGEPGRR